jgi:hypothetical protein
MADNTYNIELASIYGAQTQRGLVEMLIRIVGDDNAKPIKIQMDIAKAKHVADMLVTAIEAAISDELLVRFLTRKVGLHPDAAAAALLDFREMRQGSRETVNPN